MLWRFAETFDRLDLPPGPTGVDMPLGLLDGRRECDVVARARLGRAGSSVFPAPTPAHLARWRRDPRYGPGLGISAQAWNLLPRIAELDGRTDLLEVHPECSFRALDPRITASKKSAVGAGQRIRSLSAWCDVAVALGELPPQPALDDALDALAVAWSVARFVAGTAEVLPEPGAWPRIVV